jgi:hypothetical protein
LFLKNHHLTQLYEDDFLELYRHVFLDYLLLQKF